MGEFIGEMMELPLSSHDLFLQRLAEGKVVLLSGMPRIIDREKNTDENLAQTTISGDLNEAEGVD